MSDEFCNDLTVLIPTFGRPQSAKRSADRYANRVRVVIADGSESPSAALMTRQDIVYLPMPEASVYARLQAGLDRVDTDVVVLAADDDLVTYEFLASVQSAFRQEPTLSSVVGWFTDFRRNSHSQGVISPKYLGHYLDFIADGLDTSEGVGRVKKLIAHPIQWFWAAHRKETVATMLRLCDGLNGMFTEPAARLAVGLSGDFRILNVIQAHRENHKRTGRVKFHHLLDRYPELFDRHLQMLIRRYQQIAAERGNRFLPAESVQQIFLTSIRDPRAGVPISRTQQEIDLGNGFTFRADGDQADLPFLTAASVRAMEEFVAFLSTYDFAVRETSARNDGEFYITTHDPDASEVPLR